MGQIHKEMRINEYVTEITNKTTKYYIASEKIFYTYVQCRDDRLFKLKE